MTTTTITVDATDLRNILSNAAIFASTDDMAPVLNTVRLTWEPGTATVVAEATDRYLAARAHAPVTTDTDTDADAEPFTAVIPTGALKMLVAGLRPFKFGSVTLTTAQDGAVLTVTFPDGSAQTVALKQDDYPNTRKLFPAVFNAATQARPVEWGADKMGKITKVKNARARVHDPIIFGSAEPRKPVPFIIGDWFVGVGLPMFRDSEDTQPGYAALI